MTAMGVDRTGGTARRARRRSACLSRDCPWKSPDGLSYGLSGAGPPLARNGSANLLPRRGPRLPREPRSPAAAVLRSRSGLTVQAGRPVALRPPSRPHWAASQKQSRRDDMAQIGTFTRDESGAYSWNDQDPHHQRQGQHQALRARQRQGARLPGHGQRRRVRRRVEQNRPRDRSRIPLAEARRPVLHGPRLRIPGPGRQGRAQAHLVALNQPRRLAPSEAPRRLPWDYAEQIRAESPARAAIMSRRSA